MADTGENKKFTESKKALGYVVAVVSLIGAYYGGVLLGLSEAVMKDLTTKLVALGGIYIGGQSFVDMLSKAVNLISGLKNIVEPPKEDPK